MWPDRRLLDLFDVEHPIVLAPMAGAMDAELAIAVAKRAASARCRRRCSMRRSCVTQVRAISRWRARQRPVNLNFFAHRLAVPNNAREHAWREELKPYYAEFGIDPAAPVPVGKPRPIRYALCQVVEDIRAARSSAFITVCRIAAAGQARERRGLHGDLGAATTVAEARWLEANGCDVVIAQGLEAGGHRGNVPERQYCQRRSGYLRWCRRWLTR